MHFPVGDDVALGQSLTATEGSSILYAEVAPHSKMPWPISVVSDGIPEHDMTAGTAVQSAGTQQALGMGQTIFTIGHSTRTIPEFVALLKQADVDLLVDVRSIPRSRAVPQFNFDALPASLAQEGIGYQHLRALGGRRHHPKGAPPSSNMFWRVPAFRNYADYAQTDAFRAGLDDLLTLAQDHRCAIMCAEAVWWRCHRRIVADYLLARGIPVEHIMGLGHVIPATITPEARPMSDGTLRYPMPDDDNASRKDHGDGIASMVESAHYCGVKS